MMVQNRTQTLSRLVDSGQDSRRNYAAIESLFLNRAHCETKLSYMSKIMHCILANFFFTNAWIS